jgi:hypothetical protein
MKSKAKGLRYVSVGRTKVKNCRFVGQSAEMIALIQNWVQMWQLDCLHEMMSPLFGLLVDVAAKDGPEPHQCQVGICIFIPYANL